MADLQALRHALDPRAPKTGSIHCVTHDDKNPSLRIWEHGGSVRWRCMAGCDHAVLSAEIRKRTDHLMNGQAHDSQVDISTTYTYRNADGREVARVQRIDLASGDKKIWQERPDGKGGWEKKGVPIPRPLYGLDLLAQKQDAVVVICEGEKAAHAARRQLPDNYVAISWMCGAKSAHEADWKPLRGRDVIVWPDADQPGTDAASVVVAQLHGIAESVRLVRVDDLPTKSDAADVHWTIEELLKRCFVPTDAEPKQKPSSGFRVVNVLELLNTKLPPRELLLNPWLQTQALVMVFAPRGTGKTHFTLGLGYALWTGGVFLNWKATRPLRVMFIDGEMPAAVLQERLRAIIAADELKAEVPAEAFHFITPDLLGGTAPPDLTDPSDRLLLQERIDEHQPDVIIADNISTLCRSGRPENDAESWLSAQEWALKMRQQGRCVAFVHHAGKTGTQRGTSKREDVLDTIIKLSRPSDYQPDQGARFEVHFEKARHLFGDAARPFEAWLQTDSHGRQSWTTRSLEDSSFDRVIALARDGLSQKEIAGELRLNKSNVSRYMAKARELGVLPKDGA